MMHESFTRDKTVSQRTSRYKRSNGGRESKQLTDASATAATSNKNRRTFPLAKCDFEQVAYLNLSFITCKIWIMAAL